jgi:hypothetical protein
VVKGIVEKLASGWRALVTGTDILPALPLLALAVVLAQAPPGGGGREIDFRALERILGAGACAVRALGPWLALLLLAVAAILVIAGSGKAVTYGAGALIGFALVAGVPQILNSVAAMFGFDMNVRC